MLLNNFFQILEQKQGEETVVAKVKFDKNHKIFEGHFPSNPVVPGVCMIQMIKEIAEKSLDKKLVMTRADNVKFLNMVNPVQNETVDFELNIKTGDHISVKANVVSEGTTFLKFVGTFR